MSQGVKINPVCIHRRKDIAFPVIIVVRATDFPFFVAKQKANTVLFFFCSLNNLLEIIGVSEKSRATAIKTIDDTIHAVSIYRYTTLYNVIRHIFLH